MKKITTCSLAVMAIVAAVAVTLVSAYDEDRNRYKWSPQYLYKDPKSNLQTNAYGGIPQRTVRYGSFGREGSLGARLPGYRSGYYNSIYKRALKRNTCQLDGEVCIFRSGLVGAFMKMPCCEGSTCTIAHGAKYICVNNSELERALLGEYEEDYEFDELPKDNSN